jgi:hypothetical protein
MWIVFGHVQSPNLWRYGHRLISQLGALLSLTSATQVAAWEIDQLVGLI